MSYPIQIRPSSTSGNGLYSTKDVEAGGEIFSLDRPLVTALDEKRLSDTCSNCFTWTQNSVIGDRGPDGGSAKAKACTGCRTLKFCSKQCQTEAWKRHHSKDCRLLKILSSQGHLPNAARAVLQMLQLSGDGDDNLFKDMKSHRSTILEDGGERAEMLSILATGINMFTGERFGADYVQHCFSIVYTNSLTVYTPTFDALGICVDPILASANHSCDPNAYVVYDGARCSLRAHRAIKKDDEIFFTYIENTNPRYRRKVELDLRYYFECKCTLCEQGTSTKYDKFLKDIHDFPQDWSKDIEWPAGSSEEYTKTDIKDPSNYIDDSSTGQEVEKLQWLAFTKLEYAKKLDPFEALNELQIGITILLQSKIWPQYRQPLPALRQDKFINILMLDRRLWVDAFTTGLVLYFFAHPEMHATSFHPVGVVHKWTLALLALYITDSQGDYPSWKRMQEEQGFNPGIVIIGLLLEVVDNVDRSHGAGSTFSKRVKEKFEEVKTDMTRGDGKMLTDLKGQIEEQWKVLRDIAAKAAEKS